jgi:hypothetical protein
VLGEYVPYIVIGIVAAVLIAATIVLARLAWRRQVRRYIVGLIGRKEGIVAGVRTLDGVIAALAGGSIDDVLAFAAPDSEDRRVVAEVASRMRMEATELADLPLPKALWTLADELGSAAHSLGVIAGGVGEAPDLEAALDALALLDLSAIRTSLSTAEDEIARLGERYGVTDVSVYGGGLYI